MIDDIIPLVFFPLVVLAWILAFCYLFIDDFSILDFFYEFDFNFFKFEVF